MGCSCYILGTLMEFMAMPAMLYYITFFLGFAYLSLALGVTSPQEVVVPQFSIHDWVSRWGFFYLFIIPWSFLCLFFISWCFCLFLKPFGCSYLFGFKFKDLLLIGFVYLLISKYSYFLFYFALMLCIQVKIK